jgi:hypothetical protein
LGAVALTAPRTLLGFTSYLPMIRAVQSEAARPTERLIRDRVPPKSDFVLEDRLGYLASG